MDEASQYSGTSVIRTTGFVIIGFSLGCLFLGGGGGGGGGGGELYFMKRLGEFISLGREGGGGGLGLIPEPEISLVLGQIKHNRRDMLCMWRS